ncbi:hypothetical protein AB1Y20_010484 [Prymnesium parvum]|uniref:t-SNARE coiled-coil homology domain-containing protein n=1 Tax=Prymnesium parvum TaxID=97485 RepID=A0AB34IRI3_PRYPA
MAAARNRAAKGGAAYEAFLEEDNDAQIRSLGSKVSELRALSINIGQHVKSDNALLDELDGNFDSTGNILSGTMKRLGNLTNSKDSRHMLYLVVFVVVVLLLVYKLSRH